MSSTLRRLDHLEEALRDVPCGTCASWPALVIQTDDTAPDYPTRCPRCGRAASHVVRLTRRADGPQ